MLIGVTSIVIGAKAQGKFSLELSGGPSKSYLNFDNSEFDLCIDLIPNCHGMVV